MVLPTSWKIEVFRTFIETKERSKNGKTIKFPKDIRKMYIDGDFIGTTQYRATVVKRKGDHYISLYKLQAPQKPKWACPLIDKPQPSKWVKDGNYSFAQFAEWLGKLKIQNPASIVSELLTAPPENLAA
jgi:hypothetical protein